MSKAARTLLTLGWIADAHSATWTSFSRNENLRVRRLIAGNIIAGNYGMYKSANE